MVDPKLKAFYLKDKMWSKQMRDVFHHFKHYANIEYAFSGDEVIEHAYHIHNTPDNVFRLLVKILPSMIEMCNKEQLNILVTNNDAKNRPLKEYVKLLDIQNVRYYNIQDIKYIENLEWLPFNKLAPGPGCALTKDVLDKYRRLITYPKKHKKIVIIRRNNRSMPDNILLFLIKNGYEPFALEEMSVRDQINLFAGASHVVGVQGAGLANLIYCAPGTKSLEISAGFDLNLYSNLVSHINNTLHFDQKIIHTRVDRDEIANDETYATRYDKIKRKCTFYDIPVKLDFRRFVEAFTISQQ